MAAKTKRPEILHAIVGTAGHVSHGKSSLVELLAGCEMNRLPEEKARGLTIDLGFAACFLPGDRLIGMVDVPGHKDFIRNMVAGAASVDILMLVVAADDGVMPQTEEHVRIARLMGATRVMVVISKIDLVDAEMLELVKEDVKDFMTRQGFADFPVIPYSHKTFEGLDDVRETLQGLIDSVGSREGSSGAFRMNVERVFSVKGYGTVATGIPVSGSAARGDELELLPAGRRAPVRAIQTYKYSSATADAGCCAAINLRDLAVEDVARGMTVATPGVFRPTTQVVVTVSNAGVPTLKRSAEVRFHSGTSVVSASLRLIGADRLDSGEEGFAELRLAEPVVLAEGDRYILRSLSPVDTVAGGRVLSARMGRLKRGSPALVERLDLAREAAERGDRLSCALLAGPSATLPAEEVLRLTQALGDEAGRIVAEREERGELVALGDGYLVRARLQELASMMKGALAGYHESNSYAFGMTPAHACGLVGLGDPKVRSAGGSGRTGKSFRKLAEILAEADPEGAQIVTRHGRLALASFSPALSAKQMKLRDGILRRVAEAGVKAVARGDLAKDLGASAADMKLLVRLLAEEGSVTVLGNHLMHAPVFEECRAKLLALFDEGPGVDLSAFRKATGVSRNLAVAVLEKFDSEGLTRREGDARVLAKR